MITFGILYAGFFSAQLLSAAENPRVIRVGAFNYYPGIFQDANGVVKGFYVDALAEIEHKENIKFEYIYGSWSEGLDRIRKGEVDVVTSVAFTQERARFLDYCTVPLLTVWGELYVTLDSEIDSITAINNGKVAVMKDDFNAAFFMEMVKKFGITCEFVVMPGFEEVFKAVAAKTVDAGVVNSTFGTPKQIEYRLRPTGIVFNPFDIFFAVAKGKNNDIVLMLDRYLDAWRHQEDSVYNMSRQKWAHGKIGFTKVIPSWIGYAIFILAALVVIGAAFIILLRHKIAQATSTLVRQQKILRENQALLQSSIESPKDMIILAIDPEYKYLCFNSTHRESMVSAYGKHVEMGMNLLDCITDEGDRNKAKRNYDKALAGESHITIEEFGEEGRARLYYETRYNPIFLDGKIIGTTAFSANVSDRIHMLQELKESEEKYRTLLNISIDAIFVIQDSRIIYLNPAAVALFGAKGQEDLLSKSPIDLFYPDYRKVVEENIGKMLNSGEASPLIEGKILKLDETPLEVEIAAIPFMHNGARSIQVILRDITERKRAEQEIKNFNATLQRKIAERTEALEKANLELESFTHSVSHDLRAPLRVVSGFSQLLEENCEGKVDAEGHHFLRVIKANTRKMEDLIKGLLNLSQIKKGNIQYSRVDVSQLVAATLAEVAEPDVRKSFEIVMHPLPTAWADETLLRQVWFNLLSNAFKYSMKSGTKRIEIGATEEESRHVYFVKDSGVGFDPRYSEKLFGVFQRLHSTEEFEGIGVGLSIVHHIVERHGGAVWASGSPGEGAVFSFSLPKAELKPPETSGKEH